MPSTYLDCFQYNRNPTGLVTSGYSSNQFRFAAQQSAGLARITLPSTAIVTPLNAYDQLYIFDGANSEIVQVSQPVPAGQLFALLVSPLQFTHLAGTPVCADGPLGSLAQQIFTASAWVEDICHQSLWNTAYTGEVLSMPTMRAALDNQGGMAFRPLHFPVTALSAFAIQPTNAASSVSYDPTEATIDGLKRIVSVPVLKPLSSGTQNQVDSRAFSLTRSTKAILTASYTAGWTALPFPIQRACSLLVNQCFVELSNPYGTDQNQEGKRNITYTLRGDPSGESLLVKQATELLKLYSIKEA